METFSIGSLMTVLLPRGTAGGGPGSYAASGLGDAGDECGRLGRALREQLVELLDRHARGLSEDPDGRTGALLGVLGPHELDDPPVLLGQLFDPGLAGDLGGHGLGPRVGVL